MMKPLFNLIRSFLVLPGFIFLSLLSACSGSFNDAEEDPAYADIFPEYYDLTLPPNIAPLNFVIREPGSKFRVEIRAGSSEPILIRQASSGIKIPLGEWQNLLSGHGGEILQVDIWSFNKGKWHKYKSIKHDIAQENIDPYLAYRLVHAVYLKWRDMGIFQRNLSTFEETTVIENSSTGHGCMNCHSFSNNDPSKMLIHFRILNAGTLLWNDGKLSKVDTRTPATLSAGIYPAWHPGGKHIAFSTGQISPHLTTRSGKVVDVADRASDIVIYDIERNEVRSSPVVSTARRENMPVWSPDGRYMVCSMSDYGYFTIFHKESDLYCIDLATRKYNKLDLNSQSAESFSSWSSNGRWIVFSSKRMDDVFSRPHIAYFDKNGLAHKPFVLPQKDPEMYDMLLANYNLPKMITGKIEIAPEEIQKKVMEKPEPVKQGF